MILPHFRKTVKVIFTKKIVHFHSKDSINKYGEMYGIDPTVIGSIILKEQFTQSAPDTLLLADTYLNGTDHSFGLGALNLGVAKNTLLAMLPAELRPNYEPLFFVDNDGDLAYKLAFNNDFNIQTLALSLAHITLTSQGGSLGYATGGKVYINEWVGAYEGYIDQWHPIIHAYNPYNDYATKVLQYRPHIGTLLE